MLWSCSYQMLMYRIHLFVFFYLTLGPKKTRTGSQDEDTIEYLSFNPYALPWQRAFQPHHESASSVNLPHSDDINPGEFVLRALFTEFTVLAEKKIERLMKDVVSIC